MSSPVKDTKAKAQISWPGAVVVERGKGHIKHQHPTDPNRFMHDSMVGGRSFHFGDEPFTEANEVDTAWVDADPADAPWQKKMVLADYNAYAFREPTLGFDQGQLIQYVDPESGETVAFQPQQLQWTNDLDQISPIADPASVSAVVSDDTLTWTDAYGSGIDFIWKAHPVRLVKLLDIANLADIGSPPAFIIAGGNPVLKIGFLFQKSSGLEIWVDGILWNERVNNPQTTLSNVEFKITATGETIWFFKAPASWDADKDVIEPTMRLRKSGPNMFVEILTSWAWLQGATFPVTIDATVDKETAATADDCGIWDDGESFFNTSHYVYCDRARAGMEHACRFTGITIGQGDTIDVANYSLWVRSAEASPTGSGTLYAEDADNSGQIASHADFDSRVKTTANVAWAPATWANVDDKETSGEIKTVVQEVINRGGWSSGNALTIMTDCSENQNLEGQSFDSTAGGTWSPPTLHIEYTAAAAGVDITVPVATLTLAGYAPTVSTPVNIEVPEASLSLTGYAPSVATPVNVEIPAATLSITGYAPTVATPVNIEIPAASLTLTGLVPTIQTPVDITIPVASLNLTGFAPTIQAPVDIEIPVAILALTGYAPLVTVPGAVNIVVPAGTLTLTGYAPEVSAYVEVARRGGVVVGAELVDEDDGEEEMLQFWQEYYQNVLDVTKAEARLMAEEMLQKTLQDEIDLLDLVVL